MGAATTQIAGQCLTDFSVTGRGISIQQGFGGHDHAVQAITALRRLFFNKSALHRMQMLAIAQPFQRGDLTAGHTQSRDHAGACGNAVNQYGACAALSEAAAVLWAIERQIVAYHQ